MGGLEPPRPPPLATLLCTTPTFSSSLHAEVGTAPLFSSGATSAAVFLIAEAEAPLLFSANREKRQRRYI